ncbi:spike base protein, RCAP_Rcc01079 family [Loktanella sp. DJP18]|uniref:spike base protein, RCAP_Rcc01079 family n=1 Tax=Loktanella sp. DJP18 TaxID=3409788 RepID=UPI003BB7EA6A
MPAKNPFAANMPTPTGLGLGFAIVVPADADLETQLREIRVGTAPDGGGSLRVTGVNGVVANLLNVQAGELVTGPFIRIHAGGTTVSEIVGWI